MASQGSKLILIADDNDGVASLLAAMCRAAGWAAVTARTGSEALRKAGDLPVDLVIMDAVMPELDGFEATTRLKADFAHLPVIMLTGLRSREDRIKGIAAGASDFLTKPVDGEELILRVRNALKLKEYSDFLADYNALLEKEVEARTAELRGALARVTAANRETILMLATASEYKDENTGGHIRRISRYAAEIASAMGLDAAFQETIFYAAAMHDIGKVHVPDSIMLKRGKLTTEEWEIMRRHTLAGEKILAGATSPYLRMGREIAAAHHELWDGSGYPRGLKGEEIPLAARITTVADQYDALRTERPYKPAMSHDEAMRIFEEGDGRTEPRHFDPTVLRAFRECAERLRAISEGLSDTAAPYGWEETWGSAFSSSTTKR